MLSIIIPSYKDPCLQKTIDGILENAEGDIEIIAVLDGYWPVPQLEDHPNLRILHFGKNRGMRAVINAGVSISRGEYIMKCDAHCVFGKGFDKLLLERIRDDWVVVPRLYYLDIDNWKVMEGRGNDYSKILFHEGENRFICQEWIRRTKERKNKEIDENMAFQGSCWLVSRKWWDKAIKRLDEENYGSIGQEAIEIAMKTFTTGGRTMVNKKTWYAHQHRKFGRTHGISNTQKRKARDYAVKTWKDDYQRFKEYFRL